MNGNIIIQEKHFVYEKCLFVINGCQLVNFVHLFVSKRYRLIFLPSAHGYLIGDTTTENKGKGGC